MSIFDQDNFLTKQTMPEIKTENRDKLEAYMKENNLDVSNNTQICAKLMEMDNKILELDAFLTVAVLEGRDDLMEIMNKAMKMKEAYLNNPDNYGKSR